MKNLLEFLLIHLVDHPDEVNITEEEDDLGSAVYRIKVHPDDMGKVIGKSGSRIKAIRRIVQIKAAQVSQGFKIYFEE